MAAPPRPLFAVVEQLDEVDAGGFGVGCGGRFGGRQLAVDHGIDGRAAPCDLPWKQISTSAASRGSKRTSTVWPARCGGAS